MKVARKHATSMSELPLGLHSDGITYNVSIMGSYDLFEI